MNQTTAIYERCPYQREMETRVQSCTPCAKGYEVIVEQTVFYPEGGGQPADHGMLGEAKVLDVKKRDGQILHITDCPLEPGSSVKGSIDWQRRHLFMQHHTGEHIVSGIAHRLHGMENVGFHMGTEGVSIDLDGVLDEEQLKEIETLANQAVWSNLPVSVTHPDAATLASLSYRSKKELTGDVRIVTVPECDVCACCGTHVANTGEIGFIRLSGLQHYKGGVRFRFCAAD